MTITIDGETFALLLVGVLAGTAAALVIERSTRSGRRLLRNVSIGVIGALVGEFVFDELGLVDDIPDFLTGSITAADVLVAFTGAVLLMLIWRRFR